jgi:hypothetical protein
MRANLSPYLSERPTSLLNVIDVPFRLSQRPGFFPAALNFGVQELGTASTPNGSPKPDWLRALPGIL